MLAALSLLALVQGQTEADPFTRSYRVAISGGRGPCRYFVTDVGVTASQLVEQLAPYDKAIAIEILTYADTRGRCVAEARKAVARAGFRTVRVRPAAASDVGEGPP